MTRRHLPIILASLSLSGCGAASPTEEPPLKGATIGGPFTLTDQDGRRVTDAQFAGKYRIMYFGFTNCPNVCPVDLAVEAEGLRKFEAQDPERAARVQPIFVTVDPERDTPAQLKAYVANFHPRLIGLTGSPAEISAVKRAFGVYGEKGERTSGGGYNVNHSRIMYLMGPEGAPITMIPYDQGADGVAATLNQWVR